MATKKKAKKKSTRTKRSVRAKVTRTKKRVQKKKTSKKLTKKNSARKKKVLKNAASRKTVSTSNEKVPKKRQGRSASAFSREAPEPRSGEESGDLQGLSNVESADSESVDELIEEGNAFEAGVISGVEEADGEDGREVNTREVPEDDVPREYLAED